MHAGLNIELHADLHPGESATSTLEAQVVWYSDCCGLRGFSAPRAESRAFPRLNLRILSLLPALTSYRKCILFRKHDGERVQEVEQATDLSHILSVIRGVTKKGPKFERADLTQNKRAYPLYTFQERETAEHNLTICTETACFGRARSF